MCYLMLLPYSILEQMRLVLLIPSVFTEISFLVPAIAILKIVPKKEAEAGGMTTGVVVVFRQISTVFTRVVEMRSEPISTGKISSKQCRG